jgi:hypothetical protein
MIDWEDLTATDFLPGGRYFAGFAGDHDPWLLLNFPHAPAREAQFAPSWCTHLERKEPIVLHVDDTRSPQLRFALCRPMLKARSSRQVIGDACFTRIYDVTDPLHEV